MTSKSGPGGGPPQNTPKIVRKTHEFRWNFGRVWILGLTPKLKQKNGGRSALYFIPFGVSKIRQSTGKISCGAKILNHQISGRSTMDTGSYSKTKKKWRAFRPVFYTCWGVGNRAEYRKNKLWRQNLNPQNQRAFHRVLYISVCSFIYILLLLLCLLYIYIYIYIFTMP